MSGGFDGLRHILAERRGQALRPQLELERQALDPELQLAEQPCERQRGSPLPQLVIRAGRGWGGF